METKFTPGPWKTQDTFNGSSVYILKDVKEWEWIADAMGPNVGRTEDERNANARLISSAPEMYRLLERILSYQIETEYKQQVEELFKKINNE